ncbi:MAG TPA: hypothetical protein ENJ31_13530 [Anaerolineae bacterium]|nr:hypothetical protein [Anaerolineae bacterium]
MEMAPYPHIVLGEGGHKRATWIPLGRRDEGRIIEENEEGGLPRILDVGILALRDKATGAPNGRYLIVAPRPDRDDVRVLVLWSVASGYRGSASIEAGEGAKVIAYDHAWHSGRGSIGETAEMLAILSPGARLEAKISGRRIQEDRARLTWDGDDLHILFFPSDADPEASIEEGDYL